MKHEILKKYVCPHPFNYLDVQPNSQWICCPSWAPTSLNNSKDVMKEDLLKNWQGEKAISIRKSVLDGSYSHCDHNVCPLLNELINTGKSDQLLTRKQFKEKFNVDENNVEDFKGLPEKILFGFDRSCNLKCPSCRDKLVTNDKLDSDEHNVKLHLLNSIENYFGESVSSLMITGSGDPFYSKIYRDYLINFDSSKYPKLKTIHVITNGVLLTEKMWNSLKSKPYIKIVEISIDAGNKETYENVTRLNGDWDKLIANIKYLTTQNSIELMIFSMVVSEKNYTEMETLYNIICDMFKDSSVNFVVNFRQIVYWGSGAYSPIEIKQMSVFDKEHEKFNDFIQEVFKIHNKDRVTHNFHHILPAVNK